MQSVWERVLINIFRKNINIKHNKSTNFYWEVFSLRNVKKDFILIVVPSFPRQQGKFLQVDGQSTQKSPIIANNTERRSDGKIIDCRQVIFKWLTLIVNLTGSRIV